MAMKEILQTAAIIASIAVGIVFAIMAPKGFQLGPPDPVAAASEIEPQPAE